MTVRHATEPGRVGHGRLDQDDEEEGPSLGQVQTEEWNGKGGLLSESVGRTQEYPFACVGGPDVS